MTENNKERSEATALICAEIDYYLAAKNYRVKDLALKMLISPASLYNKMNNIENFTYPEFCRLCSILQLDDSTKLKLLAA